MRKHLKIIEDHRATKWMRFFDFIIDRVAFYLLIFFIAFLAGIIDGILEIYYFSKFFHRWGELGRLADILLTSIVYFLYMFIIESVSKGRSLGKLITGSKVIMIDGSTPTVKDYFYRSICRIIPFNALSFLGENGWHDSWTETRVINIKNYQAEKQAKSEIDTIGIKEIA